MPQTKLHCPFCEKLTITAFYYPRTLQITTARGSGQSGKMTYRTEEKYDILSGCSECGKSKKEIQDEIEGKNVKKENRCLLCDEEISQDVTLCEVCQKDYYKKRKNSRKR